MAGQINRHNGPQALLWPEAERVEELALQEVANDLEALNATFDNRLAEMHRTSEAFNRRMPSLETGPMAPQETNGRFDVHLDALSSIESQLISMIVNLRHRLVSLRESRVSLEEIIDQLDNTLRAIQGEQIALVDDLSDSTQPLRAIDLHEPASSLKLGG